MILDLHSRHVIAWAVSTRVYRDLAIRALKTAIVFCAPPNGSIPKRPSLPHDYRMILRQHEFRISMSGKGGCCDNAAVETFLKTIKAELMSRQSGETRWQTGMAIFDYVNGFHSPRQRPPALGWKSPAAFE